MEQMKEEMRELTGVVTAIEKSIAVMGESTGEVSRGAEHVRALARETHENIETMGKAIGSFKV